MKDTISEMKNTLEGISSRLDETKDWMSNSEDKFKKTPNQSSKREKELQRVIIV